MILEIPVFVFEAEKTKPWRCRALADDYAPPTRTGRPFRIR